MRRLLVAAVCAVVVTLWTPTTASAADEIGLSDDGTTWSSSLDGPLFDPAFRWVPGDDETRSFHVRNQSGDTASLRVEAVGLDESLFASGALTVRVRSGSGQWIDLDETQTVVEDTLAPGATRQLTVNVRFARAADSATQNLSAPLSFQVLLAGDGGDEGGETGDHDDEAGDDTAGTPSDGTLPATGSLIGEDVLATAIAAIVGGAMIVALARRRTSEENS